jgi:NAD(P)-dependent dehydrogenase (short-subunit alcohol dehydrogenase family)
MNETAGPSASIKRILVTGGTSGIGFATAVRLSRIGAVRIALNGRDLARGEAACENLRRLAPSAATAFFGADVSDKEAAAAMIESACAHLDGPIDVLVNAAGGDFAPTLFHQIPLDEIEAIVRHWLLSTMYCCSLALPRMNDGAAIVNVASDAAKVPTPGEVVVGAAMAGIAMFSRTLAMEAKRRGIRVNVVTPSLVANTQTFSRVTAGGFSAKLFEKASRAAHLGIPEPDDVAATIAFLASPDAAHMTGQVISVNGGISAG